MKRVLKGEPQVYKHKQLVGTMAQFKEHIEDRWQADMTWENYGTLWEIDHIIPLQAWDLSQAEHQRLAFSRWNLQPLTRQQNQRKGGTVPLQGEELTRYILGLMRLTSCDKQ